MKNKPTFSICIPNYNYGHLISQTIQSVLDQSYQNFEIIIVDNCSTDNSIEVIKSFKDNRILVYKNKYNIGFAPNLQQVSRLASGRYINLLSADDLMMPETLHIYSDYIKQFGDEAKNMVFFSDVYNINSKSEIIRIIKKDADLNKISINTKHINNLKNIDKNSFRVHSADSVLKKSLLTLSNPFPFLSVIYSSEMWNKVEGYNVVRNFGPDFTFNLKILNVCSNICHIKAPLFKYRIHSTLNNQAYNKNLKPYIDLYLDIIDISGSLLNKLQIKRKDLIQAYIKYKTLNISLYNFANLGYINGLKPFLFSLSAFPVQTLFQLRTILILFLILMGPLAKPIAKMLYHIKTKFFTSI